MIEWARIAALPLLVVAIALRRAERRVVTALREASATGAASAIPLPRLNRIGGWQVGRLERCGAVVRVGEDRFYFRRHGYDAFRGQRRRRAMIVLPVALALALVYLVAFG